MNIQSKKALLLIMDGWGLGCNAAADAIQQAATPFYDSLFGSYPHAQLIACGEKVGLPKGQMGNSEVGHLNIGAGRIVYQELSRIDKAIQDKTIIQTEALRSLIKYVCEQKKPLHLMGLVSDGGVHSHIAHLTAILEMLEAENVHNVFVHAFTDGRDTDPHSGEQFIKQLESACQQTAAKIATISGRYYAMDRDQRWERIKKTYDTLVKGEGQKAASASMAIRQAYEAKITDEFILPTVITQEDGTPTATIQEGDAVFCFNFRTDRCREITQVLTQKAYAEYAMYPLLLRYVTMTNYDKDYHNVSVVFDDDNLQHTLGEVLSDNGKHQIRIAETEKYPHVTYFFNGGREAPFEGEERIIIPSPKVATYDLQPEMSAGKLTEAILPRIASGEPDFTCLNFANLDMVGHTGVFKAVLKAVEVVDECVSRIVETALKNGYAIFLTADHGNADYMINDDGSVNTAHSLNPVPLFFISDTYQGKIADGKLGDLAPSILQWLEVPVPPAMTGKVLFYD